MRSTLWVRRGCSGKLEVTKAVCDRRAYFESCQAHFGKASKRKRLPKLSCAGVSEGDLYCGLLYTGLKHYLPRLTGTEVRAGEKLPSH